MTKYHILCRNNASSDVKRFKFCLPKSFLVCTLGVLVVCALAGYLFEVNSIATQGYQMHDLEKQISALKDGNEKLTLQVIGLESMTNLTDRIASLGMVSADGLSYYNAGSEVVAQK
ncbi:MAG: hypothetical protein V1763_01865 [Parcubacteria group bacterium]